FLIAVRGRDVFIAGPDTGAGEHLKTGGTSAGTANGIYTFLERYVNVRWLVPGDLGDDVPEQADVRLPAIDVQATPAFASRILPYVQNEAAAVKQWSRRQRLGNSLDLSHGHNW